MEEKMMPTSSCSDDLFPSSDSDADDQPITYQQYSHRMTRGDKPPKGGYILQTSSGSSDEELEELLLRKHVRSSFGRQKSSSKEQPIVAQRSQLSQSSQRERESRSTVQRRVNQSWVIPDQSTRPRSELHCFSLKL